MVTGRGLPTDGEGVVTILEAPAMPSEAALDPILDKLEAGHEVAPPHLADVLSRRQACLHLGLLQLVVVQTPGPFFRWLIVKPL